MNPVYHTRHSFPVESMPLGVSCEMYGFLDFIYYLSGRGRGGVRRDIVRKGETPIFTTLPVPDHVSGGPVP